jgi:hypothetical protein
MIAATWSQLTAVIRINLENVFSKRSLWIYLLALLPPRSSISIRFTRNANTQGSPKSQSNIRFRKGLCVKFVLFQHRAGNSDSRRAYRKIVRNFSFGNPPQARAPNLFLHGRRIGNVVHV